MTHRWATHGLLLSGLAMTSCAVPPPALSLQGPTEYPAGPERERDRIKPFGQGTIVQALVGASFFDEDDLKFEASEPGNPQNTVEADISTMPTLGIQGQMPLTGDSVQLGFEAGALVSWWRDDADLVAAGGGTAIIKVDVALLAVDLSAGAYVNAQVADGVRVFAGAGPLLIFGHYENEREEVQGSDVVIIDEDESTFGVGGYIRAGIEFRLKDQGFLGLTVRALSADLEFDDLEDLDLRGTQAFLSYTMGF